jgi:dGTPase
MEVQVVDAADGAAYSTHDADDALEMGLITLAELLEFPLWKQAAQRVSERWTTLAGKPLTRALVHELIAWQVADLLQETQVRLAQYGADSPAAVRRTPRMVEPSAALAPMMREVQQFLYHRVYRHPQILAVRHAAQDRLAELFDRLVQRPDLLPAGFHGRIEIAGLERTVGDYLAGMTDRYADQQHALLCP